MSALTEDTNFKVYCTASRLTEEEIYRFLYSDVYDSLEDLKEQFTIKSVPGQRPLEIFRYQNNNYKTPGYSEQDYFLIVDSADAKKDGLLLCNLKADHGFPDAVRSVPDEAAIEAASLSIANTDWFEARENAFVTEEPPMRRLVVYDNRASKEPNSFLRLAEAVDNGLHYVFNDPDNDEPPPLEQSLDDLFRYTAVELDGHVSTNELCKQHQRRAEETNLDQDRFAVVDDRFPEKGVLLLQVEPRREFHCKPPAAGELLWWNAIGLMSWHEIEEFASHHSGMEYRWTVDCMTRLQREAGSGSKDPDTGVANSDDSDHVEKGEATQHAEKRRFRYYSTRLGKVIASMEPYEVPSTFTRPREESDGVGEDGQIGPVEDTFVEELPWDYYLKKDDAK
ncbi:hypothetical protein LMH87_004814 [Akanthomyces muscarius]|uniref:Uncharacterized protein n=1 Tax=Akanthomyces muscarius TaxID=2231603 RepID=A0A9W8Q4T8_AKAMU|nr:hypothetical protein LMH87_004814 [Akanthomyces muscarius]KAJ4145983.1 hypothetical protein LMH87_004814 [Akanthomyces muscarius]